MHCRKGVLRNFTKFTGKHLCQGLVFNKVTGPRPATLLKETLTQAFSREFCEISKNTFFLQNNFGGCFCLYEVVGSYLPMVNLSLRCKAVEK